MQFNPTDKSDSIVADIDFLLFGDSSVLNTSYSLVDRTRNVNISYDEVVAVLFRADPNFMWDDTTNTDFPIAKLALEANRDDYVLPDASLVFNRVRVKDPNGTYVTLSPKLRREFSDSELDATGTPSGYYKIDNAVILVPTPDYGATLGVEIEFQRGANHFVSTDTTKKPGFAAQFHQFLSVSASLRYAVANGMKEKMSTLSSLKAGIIKDIQEHYQLRSPDERPRLKLRKAPVSNYRL